jgi:hypothetical protein
MIRFAIIIAALLVASPCPAQCPGGRCPRPVRSIVQAAPTLAPRARTTVAAPHKHSRVERSVVVRRHHVRRGPGFFARITFRPSHR